MSLPAQVETPISAQEAVSAVQEYAALRSYGNRVYGICYDACTGSNRLCLFEGGQAIPLLPDRFSVRSRVHEYGGGAWCLSGRDIYFVNDTDQQIWHCTLDKPEPLKLTAFPDTRFADLLFDLRQRRLVAVSETHREGAEPVNRLVSITAGGDLLVLAEGADFYSSPAISPNGKQLAWIEWDHPAQPWLDTRLCLAHISMAGGTSDRRTISNQLAAWAQPRYSPDGVLHVVVDRDNWWRVERYVNDRFEPLGGTPETEYTTAPWQFGLSTYGWGDDGVLYALGQRRGYTQLQSFSDGVWHPVQGVPANRLHSLCMGGESLHCVAEYGDRLPAVISLVLGQREMGPRTLCGGGVPAYPVCEPQPREVRLEEGISVPYFLYRPKGIEGIEPEGPLPLVIYTHGGPTAAAAPVFKPAIQYWTQRGFMIADVNYRGSTGYGREYRQLLQGQWGVFDVEDVHAVAEQLIDQSQADTDAVFIRGNSAGGFTTLCALVSSNRFRAGASLYGVSDPARLNEITHKFESHYLQWLIGDPYTQGERFRDRSPLQNVKKISAPVIFFQGEKDRVVLPEQTRSMAEQLLEKGGVAEQHYFSDEGHGFRAAENQAFVLEKEVGFYQIWGSLTSRI